MGTDNKELALVYETDDGVLVPIDTIHYVGYDVADPGGDQSNFDCSSFSVTLTVDLGNELAGHWAMLRRLLRLDPLPKKLSRKRFVKWLMAIGVPRDYAAAAAAAAARDCGSYAAAWADLVNHYGTEAGLCE